jgi:glyoxylase-like metal-dependent hydrolase (beta-lactamase superfamily II)
MQKVTENVFVETKFRGCNTSIVVTSEGVVIIDTPMVPAEAKKWKEEALRHGKIRYVINTEPHTDHAAGDFWFDAPVVAHEGTRQELLGAKKEDLEVMLKGMGPDALPLDPAYHYRLPEITFSPDLTLYLGKHTFHLINMPGHTASETAVYVPEERIVFTGDNLNLMIPIFVKSQPFAWLESLKRIQALDVDKVVPGHGEVSTKACIPGMAQGVQYWIDNIQSAINRGLSLEETLKQVTMADRYPFAQNPPLNVMFRNSIIDVYKTLKK